MGRKKKDSSDKKVPIQIIENVDKIVEVHTSELETNLEYSLLVDPTNKYNMSDEQKQFVHLYCELKNKALVQILMNIDTEVANAYFVSYASQQEIRRINRAMLQRRFNTKMLNLNEIGGYLTSLITEEYVADADRLSPKDKLQVISMLKDLIVLKAETAQNANVIDYNEIELAAKDMSIDAIRTMLSMRKNKDDAANINSQKETLISAMNKDDTLLPEEIDYLKTLSVTELMSLVNNISKK